MGSAVSDKFNLKINVVKPFDVSSKPMLLDIDKAIALHYYYENEIDMFLYSLFILEYAHAMKMSYRMILANFVPFTVKLIQALGAAGKEELIVEVKEERVKKLFNIKKFQNRK